MRRASPTAGCERIWGDDATNDQYVTRWPEGGEFVRRGTSATSVGDPEPQRLLPSATADLTLIEADIFDWDAGARIFDAIFFSAWLHHVPRGQFDRFWGTVERLLAPGGVVIFDFLDARVPSPGRVDIPEVPADDYTFYAPVNGVSVRDLHGRRWRVVHNLWRPDELAGRLNQSGWEFAILGPGLLSNMLWATAHR